MADATSRGTKHGSSIVGIFADGCIPSTTYLIADVDGLADRLKSRTLEPLSVRFFLARRVFFSPFRTLTHR